MPPQLPPLSTPPHKQMTSSNQDSPSSSFHWHYGADLDDRNFEIHGRALFFLIMLISITLLVTILFLYTRWICRHRPTTASAVSTASVAHAPPLKPPGLDAVSINSLPFVLFREAGQYELAECAICLGIFVDSDKVKVLPNCRHCYHCECVDKWLTSHSSCPLCRDSIRVDSPV